MSIVVSPRLLRLIALAVAIRGAEAASAQVVASERATLTQTLSGTEISIDYSRPSARGRSTLFGGQVPWDEVWTPGANTNTKFRFSKDVTLGGETVEAGTYGVWMQVREEGPWRLMLHGDTTLFHTQHPLLEDGILDVPATHELARDFVETLTFDLQELRADGARLVMAWGFHRVSADLGVDPGFVVTVSDAEGARYVGAWILDESMGVPPDSMQAAIKAGLAEDDVPAFEAYVRTASEPQAIELHHEAGHLRIVNPVMDAIMASVEGEGWETVLLPRAEGIFEPGTLFRGELAFAGDRGLWEFEFDDTGRAVAFVIRDPADEIVGRGARAGEGG